MQLTGIQIAMIIIVVDFIILLISEILMKKHLIKKIMFPKTSIFMAINTAKGSIGIIDSRIINDIPIIKAINILLF